MGELKAKKLLEELNNSRSRPLSRFLTGLGIPGVGEVASRDIAREYGNLKELRRTSEEDLTGIKA